MQILPRVAISSLAGLILATHAPADPPEDRNAWTSAPHGWHLDQLGPTTRAVSANAFAVVLHVSAGTGDDATGDGSATAPLAGLAKAISRASTLLESVGSVGIFVAEGTYSETPYTLQAGIHLYGGFNPETWERDIHLNPTVLDGGGSRRVLIGADDSTIDGFVVAHGKVADHGAGLYCHESSPTVTNNVFLGNHAAEPADYSHDKNRRRQRGHDGGAIALVNYANPAILNNLFIRNSTGVGYGAAISARDDCIPKIGYNVFWENICGTNDDAITRSSNGGAIGLLNSSRAAIIHNLFAGNQAQGGSDGGAIFCEYFSWPEIRWNVFLNNYAGDDGGALDSQKFSHPKVKYNLFFGNQVDGSGGAVHHDDAAVELENNVFAYNAAHSQAGAFGGSHGWIRAVNNTVVENRAVGKGGGAVHHYNMKNPYLKPILLRNNIFWGNRPDELFLESGGDVHYNIVEGGHDRAYGWYDMDPAFRRDEVFVEVVRTDPAAGLHQTRIQVKSETPLAAGSLKGRVFRLLACLDPAVEDEVETAGSGDNPDQMTAEDGVTENRPQFRQQQAAVWSLIIDNGTDWIRAWGPLELTAGGQLEVIKTFHLSPESPAINNGLYQDYAADDFDGQPRYTPTIDFGADEYVPEESGTSGPD
ncbi:MAG: DUF1565 domain-containing protein [Opitutaceae bacterium]